MYNLKDAAYAASILNINFDKFTLEEFLDGKQVGTRFHANENPNFKLEDYIMESMN